MLRITCINGISDNLKGTMQRGLPPIKSLNKIKLSSHMPRARRKLKVIMKYLKRYLKESNTITMFSRRVKEMIFSSII